jgi:hypothetical protein
MKHYILTRFSVLFEGFGFTKDNKNLFSAKRLNTRFQIFETFTLPSMLNQTSQNFEWIIFIDKKLPPKYLKRLKELTKKENIHLIVFVQGELNINKLQFIEDKLEKINDKYVITTRLDDDDCLAKDFVERIQKDANKFKNEDFMFLSYPKGLHWKPSEPKLGFFSEYYYPSIALGLSIVVNRLKYPITVHGWHHKKIVEKLEEKQNDAKSNISLMAKKCGDHIAKFDMKSKFKLIDTPGYVYIRTVHGTNDAARLDSNRYFNERVEDVKLSDFGIDKDKLMETNKKLT